MASSKFVKKLTSMAIVGVGGVAAFAGISFYNGNEKFYENILMPTIQKVSGETAHELAIFLCKHNLFPSSTLKDPESLKISFFNHQLSNPVGIAAGFDKQGEAVENLERIGFGFVEIGSVTPQPQPGNPKPRVFRSPLDEAIINRYGFNSLGHAVVFENLKGMKERQRFKGVLGVNLGKNKTSENALEDYSKGLRLFSPIADYIVVNVSSPNTPGLRSLQSKKELQELLTNLLKIRESLPAEHRKPVLLKLAPDLTKDDVNDIVTVVTNGSSKIDGLIISNTTIGRGDLKNETFAREAGGLSGLPLKLKSTQLIAEVYSLTKGKIPIIGVGGIFSGQDAFDKIEAGSSFLQLYTAFALHGPPVVEKIKSELDGILKEKGFKSIEDAVGSNYKKYLIGKK